MNQEWNDVFKYPKAVTLKATDDLPKDIAVFPANRHYQRTILERTSDSSHSFPFVPPSVFSCNAELYLLRFVQYFLYLISTRFWASIRHHRPSPWVMAHLCLHCLMSLPLRPPPPYIATMPFYPLWIGCSTLAPSSSHHLVITTTLPTIHSHPFPLTTPPTLITFPYSLLRQHLIWNITRIIPAMIVPMDGYSMMISIPTASPP